MAEPRQVFEALIDGVTHRRWAELPDLYAENTVVDHPFLGNGQRMVGRDRLRAHFAAGGTLPLRMAARNVVVHQTVDPEVIVGEFEYHGEVTTTGRTFVARNIFVMRVRDGLIHESRDYSNHLVLAHAMGRPPSDLIDLFENP